MVLAKLGLTIPFERSFDIWRRHLAFDVIDHEASAFAADFVGKLWLWQRSNHCRDSPSSYVPITTMP